MHYKVRIDSNKGRLKSFSLFDFVSDVFLAYPSLIKVIRIFIQIIPPVFVDYPVDPLDHARPRDRKYIDLSFLLVYTLLYIHTLEIAINID